MMQFPIQWLSNKQTQKLFTLLFHKDKLNWSLLRPKIAKT